MAGKSNKGRNRKGSHTAASSGLETPVQSDVLTKDNVEAVTESANTDVAEVAAVGDVTSVNSEVKESEVANEGNQQKQGEFGSRSTFVVLFHMK